MVARGGGVPGGDAAPPRGPRVRPRAAAQPAPAHSPRPRPSRRPAGRAGEPRPPSPPDFRRRGCPATRGLRRRPPPAAANFPPKFPRGRRADGRAGGGGRAGVGPGPGLAGGSVSTGLPLPTTTPPRRASRPPDARPSPRRTRGRGPGRSPGPRSLRRRPSLAAHPAPAPQARDPLTPRRKCGRPPGRLTAGALHSPRPAPERQRPSAQSAPGPRAAPGGGTMLIICGSGNPRCPSGVPPARRSDATDSQSQQAEAGLCRY